MQFIMLIGITFFTLACNGSSIELGDKINLPEGTKARVLVMGEDEKLAAQAKELGLTVSGNEVLLIEGRSSQLEQLLIKKDALLAQDESLETDQPSPFKPDEQGYFLAKKDFDLHRFWERHPQSDGRKVVVGVIDDGVSPFHEGFAKTTTGERKLLRKGSRGTAFTYSFTDSHGDSRLREEQGEGPEQKWIDINGNLEKDEFLVRPHSTLAGSYCIDISLDEVIDEANECLRDFAKTGDYLYWDEERVRVLSLVEMENGQVKFLQGEDHGDSHGEGVASVMAGHLIGGRYSGVAPGAQFIDYDLSAGVFDDEEGQYSIATFLLALDWMGQHGAEVVNISYSLYFNSYKSQLFMAEAIDRLVEKYNFLIVFSAGNNGPGLRSMNRALIYPESSLAIGAYSSPELAANVHGVTGLPEAGQVVRYSSRGPAIDGGSGPDLIGPLNSIVHQNKGVGLRAFSGTSSAAPSVAGLATVLISHLKSLDLPIHAPTLAAALRRSGSMIDTAAYVEQGFGLPNIQEAVLAYQDMLAAKAFANVSLSIDSKQYPGKGKGKLLFASRAGQSEEIKVRLKGIAPQVLDKDLQDSVMEELRIEYTVPWLQGPSKAILSQGSTYQYVFMDLDAIGDVTPGSEIFGEVRYRDQKGRVVAVLPVTYLVDSSLGESYQSEVLEIGAQAAVRKHFYVPKGIQGLALDTKLISGNSDSLHIEIFDRTGNAVSGATFMATQTFIPVKSHGWYQVAVSRKGGSRKKYQFSFSLDPIQLALRDQILREEQGTLTVENLAAELNGVIEVKPLPKLLDTEFKEQPTHEKVVFELPVQEVGNYKLEIDTVEESWVKLDRTRCKIQVHSAEDKLLYSSKFSARKTFKVKEEYLGGKAQLSCMNFEYTRGLAELPEKVLWRLRRLTDLKQEVLAEASIGIAPWESRVVTLRWDNSVERPDSGEVGIFIRSHIPQTQALPIGALMYLPKSQ